MRPGEFPPVERSAAHGPRLLELATQTGYAGCDLEYTQRLEPTIASLSAGGAALVVSTDWNSMAPWIGRMVEQGVALVGHAFLTADKPIIERELGIEIPLEKIHDTMLLHYLCNAELCALPKTQFREGDVDDRRGAGHMDLWTMSSIYTEYANWKQCRGSRCFGPCRVHDPEGYNGIDSASPDCAFPRLEHERAELGISDDLVRRLKKLSIVCQRMEDNGIKVDRDYLDKLETRMQDEKDKLFPTLEVEVPCGVCARMKKPRKGSDKIECKKCAEGKPLKRELAWQAPFNPRAGAAAVAWFDSKGINLSSSDRDEVAAVLRRIDRRPEAYDQEAREWLKKWHDFKGEGKGLKSWFDERYIDLFGFIHPRFIVPATSMGRLASANPNFQNIPKRGFGKKVRGGIIPRDPSLKFVISDKRQLELRMCLWESGVTEDFSDDAFTWLVNSAPVLFKRAAELSPDGKSPRDVAKRVSHAGDYLEGLTLIWPNELDNETTVKQVRAGALVVYKDWEYHGALVAFTGVNLADALFGDHSYEHRKQALEIQESYFKRFSEIRAWHRRVTEQAERGFVRSVWSTRYLRLNAIAERGFVDKAKEGAAFYGQGQGADEVLEGIERFDDLGITPLWQVHDELAFEVPIEWSNEHCLEYVQPFAAPSKIFPGFQCPIETKVGRNWLDYDEKKSPEGDLRVIG